MNHFLCDMSFISEDPSRSVLLQSIDLPAVYNRPITSHFKSNQNPQIFENESNLFEILNQKNFKSISQNLEEEKIKINLHILQNQLKIKHNTNLFQVFSSKKKELEILNNCQKLSLSDFLNSKTRIGINSNMVSLKCLAADIVLKKDFSIWGFSEFVCINLGKSRFQLCELLIILNPNITDYFDKLPLDLISTLELIEVIEIESGLTVKSRNSSNLSSFETKRDLTTQTKRLVCEFLMRRYW